MNLLLILGIIVVVLYVLGNWSSKAGETLRRSAVVGASVLLVLLIWRGGAAFLLPLLIGLFPLARRWYIRRQQSTPASGAGGRTSQSAVQTRFLRMALDHNSGRMNGTVCEGHFAGRELDDMDLEELLLLWQECQADPQSVAVLEAYLDRTRSEDWRALLYRRQDESRARDTPMDRREAYEILGLAVGASREEVKAAHRRLMQRVHPDHGGSTYLAARVNRAKDLLLED